jgi:outer membrane biosynthesis protein TonB
MKKVLIIFDMKKVLIISVILVFGLSALIFAFFYKSETTIFAQSSAESNKNCQTNNSNQSNTPLNSESNQCDFSKYKTLKTQTLKAISIPQPKYPNDKNISGCIPVKILVDKDGNVSEACSLTDKEKNKSCKNRIDNSLFKQLAEESALKAKFDLRKLSLNSRDFFEMTIVYNFSPSK